MSVASRLLVLCVLLIGGCAGGAQLANVNQMSLPLEEGARFNGRARLAGKVAVGSVATEGNRNLMGFATAARMAEFREALQRSLDDARLAAPGQGSFVLNAIVTEADAGLSGDRFSLSVTYTLVRAGDGGTVLRESIATSDAAGLDDSLLAASRQALSINGAFRKSITRVIEKLYAVRVP